MTNEVVVDGEDPFDLIKKGNAFETASDYWRSAEFYSRASTSLKHRADNISSQIRSSSIVYDEIAYSEKKKVVSLYRAQSLEYMYKARHSLLEALQFENDQDRKRTVDVAQSGSGSLDPLYTLISEDECEKRRLIFQTLFTGSTGSGGNDIGNNKVEIIPTQSRDVTVGDDNSIAAPTAIHKTSKDPTWICDKCQTAKFRTLDEAEKHEELCNSTVDHLAAGEASSSSANEIETLESRLAKLDTSLLPNVPDPFISGSRNNDNNDGGGDSEDRLEEIQRGLKGLGVSLPDNQMKKDFVPENLSSEDQVKLIIQQAQDEVHVENGVHTGEGGYITQNYEDDDAIDENDSMFEGFVDDDLDPNEDDVDNLILKAQNLISALPHESMGPREKDQNVRIKKVQAMLLEARLCLELVHGAKPSPHYEKQITDPSDHNISDDDTEQHENSNEISKINEERYSNDGPNVAARKNF